MVASLDMLNHPYVLLRQTKEVSLQEVLNPKSQLMDLYLAQPTVQRRSTKVLQHLKRLFLQHNQEEVYLEHNHKPRELKADLPATLPQVLYSVTKIALIRQCKALTRQTALLNNFLLPVVEVYLAVVQQTWIRVLAASLVKAWVEHQQEAFLALI